MKVWNDYAHSNMTRNFTAHTTKGTVCNEKLKSFVTEKCLGKNVIGNVESTRQDRKISEVMIRCDPHKEESIISNGFSRLHFNENKNHADICERENIFRRTPGASRLAPPYIEDLNSALIEKDISQGTKLSSVELIVSNLDYNISAREWKQILYAEFSQHIQILSVTIVTQNDNTNVAMVIVNGMEDAQYLIAQFHRKKIGYKRIHIAVKNSLPNIMDTRSKVLELLHEMGGQLPIYTLFELYSKRYHQNLSVSSLSSMNDVINFAENTELKIVSLLQKYGKSESIQNFQTGAICEMKDLSLSTSTSQYSEEVCYNILLLLMEEPSGSLIVDELITNYWQEYNISLSLSVMQFLSIQPKYFQIIKEVEIKLSPLMMFARDIRTLLLSCGRLMALCDVEAAYKKLFGVHLIPCSYGHCNLTSLVESISDIIIIDQCDGSVCVKLQKHFSQHVKIKNRIMRNNCHSPQETWQNFKSDTPSSDSGITELHDNERSFSSPESPELTSTSDLIDKEDYSQLYRENTANCDMMQLALNLLTDVQPPFPSFLQFDINSPDCNNHNRNENVTNNKILKYQLPSSQENTLSSSLSPFHSCDLAFSPRLAVRFPQNADVNK